MSKQTPPQLRLDGKQTTIVAELSANHNGSLQKAIETIQAAAEAGADAIKIQTYTPDTMTIDCDREDFVVRGGLWDGRTLYDLYREAHTPWEWHPELKRAANDAGLPLFSTPFDLTAVDFLAELGVPAYKIASFELTDVALLCKVAERRQPIILSTGMGTLAEIDEAVRTIRVAWCAEDHGLVLLHCVSAYPAPAEQCNLATIPHLAAAFGVAAGLSDHTLGTAVSVAAVALGACLIERHFTLRRADGGPDSAFSLEPDELRALVRDVRQAEEAVGAVRYGATEAEQGNLVFRRSIYLVKDVARGERFSTENVRVIRPGYGMAPALLDRVLGRRAARDCSFGTPLTWELLE